MPTNSAVTAEIFGIFRRPKPKSLFFLEWHGVFFLGNLYEVHSLQKIHPVCNILEITSLRQ